MKILVFDNYDSFTYNLVHMVEKIVGIRPDVYQNDSISLEKVNNYDKIILSPGPSLSTEADLLLKIKKKYAVSKSILGVCLGHQAIAEAFGGRLHNLSTVYHGVDSNCTIFNNRNALFKGLPENIKVGHYHSWVVSEVDFPQMLEITARDENGNIMALQHKQYDVKGVQFHPESILTPQGELVLANWLK